MQISSMSKTAVPMLDYIMLGPVLALVNIGLNVVIPEHYILIAMTVSGVSEWVCLALHMADIWDQMVSTYMCYVLMAFTEELFMILKFVKRPCICLLHQCRTNPLHHK